MEVLGLKDRRKTDAHPEGSSKSLNYLHTSGTTPACGSQPCRLWVRYSVAAFTSPTSGRQLGCVLGISVVTATAPHRLRREQIKAFFGGNGENSPYPPAPPKSTQPPLPVGSELGQDPVSRRPLGRPCGLEPLWPASGLSVVLAVGRKEWGRVRHSHCGPRP